MGSHSSTQMAASSRRSPIVGRWDRMGAAAGTCFTCDRVSSSTTGHRSRPAPPPGDPTQGPVGTGPWRFVAWQHDDYLLFARNPSYWGGAPAGDTLTVRIIPEPLTRAAEFEAGRLSVIEVPFGETARWRAERPGQ